MSRSLLLVFDRLFVEWEEEMLNKYGIVEMLIFLCILTSISVVCFFPLKFGNKDIYYQF